LLAVTAGIDIKSTWCHIPSENCWPAEQLQMNGCYSFTLEVCGSTREAVCEVPACRWLWPLDSQWQHLLQRRTNTSPVGCKSLAPSGQHSVWNTSVASARLN